MIDRRTFIGMAAGGLLAVPLGARAQNSSIPIIGFLSGQSPGPWAPYVAAFRTGLNEAGYVEGKNVAIEFRWAEGQYDRLPALAADLVRRDVAVLVAAGGGAAALAAQKATATIPVVFTLGADPVKYGLVANLGRPGANITGATFLTDQLHAKRLELLHELVPKANVIAVLVNPENPNAESARMQVQEAARMLGQQVHVLQARTEREIDAAFAAISQLRAGALFVASDGFFLNRHEQFGALAAHHAVPSSFELREFVTAGGLRCCARLQGFRRGEVDLGDAMERGRPNGRFKDFRQHRLRRASRLENRGRHWNVFGTVGPFERSHILWHWVHYDQLRCCHGLPPSS